MKKDKFGLGISNHIEKSLGNSYLTKQAPKWAFVLIIILQVITWGLVTKAARNPEDMVLFGMSIPAFTFTGVFSSLGNICIIFLVVFYRKTGFITALIILFIHEPVHNHRMRNHLREQQHNMEVSAENTLSGCDRQAHGASELLRLHGAYK